MPLFLVLFLVVRGVPAMLLYRRVLGSRDRVASGCSRATELPLVVAITTIAVADGHMRSVHGRLARRRGGAVDGDLPARRPAVARRPRERGGALAPPVPAAAAPGPSDPVRPAEAG